MTAAISSFDEPVVMAARLASHTRETASGCWVTDYRHDRWGYGKFKFLDSEGRRRMTGCHRAAWLIYRSDITAGLVVDHLCYNPACCNPWHLELVTVGENNRRAAARRRLLKAEAQEVAA